MADLNLVTVATNKVRKVLVHNVVLPAGTTVKVEFGEDELDEVVPTGKKWAVHAGFYIAETDA